MKIVLTGGPCAGKTTMTHVIARAFSESIVVLPEAATLLFSGGFPRWLEPGALKATQRAIFYVQRELEDAYEAKYPDKILVLDRGTVDGAAYWPAAEGDYFAALGTTHVQELARYNQVIYLASASHHDYEKNREKNLNRIESWQEAVDLDSRNFKLWEKHPSLTHVFNNKSFSYKMSEVLAIISATVSAHTAG